MILRNRSLSVSAIIVSVSILSVGVILDRVEAEQPRMPPGMAVPGGGPPGMPALPGTPTFQGPQIETVELTDRTARSAIDAYVEMKEKYGDEVSPPDSKKHTAEVYAAHDGMVAIVNKHGFETPEQWHKTMVTVALGYGVQKEGKGKEIDESIAKLENNPQIPAAMKQQLLGMMKKVRPSENNEKVVSGLVAEEKYRKFLEAIDQ